MMRSMRLAIRRSRSYVTPFRAAHVFDGASYLRSAQRGRRLIHVVLGYLENLLSRLARLQPAGRRLERAGVATALDLRCASSAAERVQVPPTAKGHFCLPPAPSGAMFGSLVACTFRHSYILANRVRSH